MLPLGRLALPVLLAAGSLALAGPAAADVSGGTSTSDVVLYDHCQQHPISYDVLVSPGTALWSVEIQVFDPDGFGYPRSTRQRARDRTTSRTDLQDPRAWRMFASSTPAW